MLRRRDFRITTTSSAARPFELRRWRLPVEIALWTLSFVVLVLPLHGARPDVAGARRRRAAERGERRRSRTTASCCSSTRPTRRAFRNSFGLSATAAIVIVLIAVPLAYFLVWRRSRAAARRQPRDRSAVRAARRRARDRGDPPVPEAAARARHLALQHDLDHPLLLPRALPRARPAAGRQRLSPARPHARGGGADRRRAAAPAAAHDHPSAASRRRRRRARCSSSSPRSTSSRSRRCSGRSGAETLGVVLFSFQQGGDSTYAAALACSPSSSASR